MADYVAIDPGIVVVTNVVSSVVHVNVEQRVNRMVRLERIWRKRAQCIDALMRLVTKVLLVVVYIVEIRDDISQWVPFNMSFHSNQVPQRGRTLSR